MSRAHEKLLVAVLAGLIIAGAGLFAIQPVVAHGSAPAPATAALAVPAAYTILDLRIL